MNTKRKGDITELSVAKKLLDIGYSVSFPFGDNERYDLIVDYGKNLKKSQIRHAVKRGDYLVFKCYSNHRKNGKIRRTTFKKGEIDEFLVWNEVLKNVYRIPIEQTPNSEMRLRLNPTDNNQSKNVNWAKEYQIQSR